MAQPTTTAPQILARAGFPFVIPENVHERPIKKVGLFFPSRIDLSAPWAHIALMRIGGRACGPQAYGCRAVCEDGSWGAQGKSEIPQGAFSSRGSPHGNAGRVHFRTGNGSSIEGAEFGGCQEPRYECVEMIVPFLFDPSLMVPQYAEIYTANT